MTKTEKGLKNTRRNEKQAETKGDGLIQIHFLLMKNSP